MHHLKGKAPFVLLYQVICFGPACSSVINVKLNPMKKLTFLTLFTCGVLLLLATGCKKVKINIPELTTSAVTEITRNTANTGGTVTSDGGAEVIARGVCWGTAPNPTTSNNTSLNGAGTGTFTVSLVQLCFNTTYYLRAFATNSEGTAYGNAVIFKTGNSDFAIGQNYGGGIIFYLDYTGNHGLICADADQGKVYWSNESKVTGATATDIGTGQANTMMIVTLLKPLGISSAAQICDELELNGYNDWFLPSKEEVTQMYNLVPLALGGFSWNTYWSSSETSLTNAWCENFRLGEHHDWNKNTSTYHVRAVRAF